MQPNFKYILFFFVFGVAIVVVLDAVVGLTVGTQTLIILGSVVVSLLPIFQPIINKIFSNESNSNNKTEFEKVYSKLNSIEKDLNDIENEFIRLSISFEATNNSDVMETIRKLSKRVHKLETSVDNIIEHLDIPTNLEKK